MRRLFSLLITVVLVGAVVPEALAQESRRVENGTTYVEISGDGLVVGNALVERTWSRSGWATTSFIDKRSADGVVAGRAADFTLDAGTAGIASDRFRATTVDVDEIVNGLRINATLVLADGSEAGLMARRTIEIYDGIAGMRTQTTISSVSPFVLRGYTLEQHNVGTDVAATLHAFRAGADWREPDWAGPKQDERQPFIGSVGDPHAGTWRDTDRGQPGQSIAGPAQWISTGKDDTSLFMVMERNDYPSSRAGYSGGLARLNVDYSADIVMLGPFEENWHAENPLAGEAPGRHRVIEPGEPYTLEAAFVGFGANPDDEPWQFYKYLSEHRLDPYDAEVTFNSNGTDANVRSDGAKDDMVEEVIEETAPLAKRLGVETFILDDGWQARSGDWEPDCGTTPGASNTDPRWDGSPTSKFRPRYTDCTFDRVRELIAPMELGLWWTPMSFHPRSSAYMSHPQWACKPVGDATGATSILQPNGGSNDAGIGLWSTHPDLIGHIESRIQNAIDNWGVTYFKFDFLVWLDCVGQDDLYGYKEAFVALLDRLIAKNPEVTFQIDETNDYRLFPFESVTRSPSWFQNGSPPPDRLLHNLWNLAPYIPAYSLGQHFLGGNQYRNYPVDTLMAIALPGHLTFFSDLRDVPPEVLDQARPWVDFYTTKRDHFKQMTYPLLADPLDKTWSALQTWNPEEGKGALLAYRQDSPDATRSIALRNVPAGMTFDLFEGPTGAHIGTVTSEQLRQGIDITIPAANGARVVLIEPAAQQEFDPTTTLTYTGDTATKPGRSITLAATLTGSDGPIEGAAITFEFHGVTYTATTDSTGTASATTERLVGQPGLYEVVARFAGNDRYSPSSTTATVRVGN